MKALVASVILCAVSGCTVIPVASPPVVYRAPIVYTPPVVYRAPIVYTPPVYYHAPAPYFHFHYYRGWRR